MAHRFLSGALAFLWLRQDTPIELAYRRSSGINAIAFRRLCCVEKDDVKAFEASPRGKYPLGKRLRHSYNDNLGQRSRNI